MIEELRKGIKKLSISERILLAEEIWDSVALESKSFKLNAVQKKVLEKRSNDFKKNPELGRDWEEIRAEFLGT